MYVYIYIYIYIYMCYVPYYCSWMRNGSSAHASSGRRGQHELYYAMV